MNQVKTEISKKFPFPLKAVYFYLTKGCNLKCRHCWLAPKHEPSPKTAEPVLRVDQFSSIINQAKSLGLTSVKLTGGEPLLHPQIRDILRIVQSEQLQLTIETNGVLCSPDLAEAIQASSKNLSISVSLDGATAEVHDWIRGVEGSFEAAINGIQNLVRVGIRPQIIMSVMRKNFNQIHSLIRLAEDLGASSLKFNPVQPTARGDEMHKAMGTLSIKELVDLGNQVQNRLSSSTNLKLLYTQPIAFHALGRILGDKGDGCGVCGILSILGVLADGSFSLCGIGETVPDLVFGHVDIDNLEDVWIGTSILNELREGLPDSLEGTCRDCLMNAVCQGSCIAQNYYLNNSIWAPNWYCEEAINANLFPLNRLRTSL